MQVYINEALLIQSGRDGLNHATFVCMELKINACRQK